MCRARTVVTKAPSKFYEHYICLDERDRIQKKTFTKWCNQHLKKVTSLESAEQKQQNKDAAKSNVDGLKVDKRNTLSLTSIENNETVENGTHDKQSHDNNNDDLVTNSKHKCIQMVNSPLTSS